jgi:hypothetical protein
MDDAVVSSSNVRLGEADDAVVGRVRCEESVELLESFSFTLRVVREAS